jgi:hypothetical protein
MAILQKYFSVTHVIIKCEAIITYGWIYSTVLRKDILGKVLNTGGYWHSIERNSGF